MDKKTNEAQPASEGKPQQKDPATPDSNPTTPTRQTPITPKSTPSTPPKDTTPNQSTAAATTAPTTPNTPQTASTPKTDPKPGGPTTPPPTQGTTAPKNPTPTAPPPHQDHKSLPKWILALIVLFVVALLGIGGYAVYSNMTGTSATPTPTPSPQTQAPTPTPDPTADWQLYSNEVFSIKLPPTINNEEVFITEEQNQVSLTNIESTPVPVGATPRNIVVNSEENLNSQTLDEYVTSRIESSTTPENLENVSRENITINGSQGISVTNIPSANGALEVYLTNEDNFIHFYISPYANQAADTAQLAWNEAFNQILSTFQFIQPASILPISPETSTPSGGVTQCTLDAKICPDGSSVGRTGPNCEFAPCPPLQNE